MPLKYGLRTPNQLFSPQIGAVSVGMRQRFYDSDYEDYIEGMAEELPAIESEQYQRDVMEQQQAFNEKNRRFLQRDAIVSSVIQGAELGIKGYPMVKKGIGYLASKTIPQASSIVPKATEYGYYGFGELGEKTVGKIAGIGAEKTAGVGLPSIGSFVSPAAAGYGVGSLVKGARLGKGMNKVFGTKDEKSWNRTAGALGGAMAGAKIGTAIGSVVPGVGNIVGAIIGGITGLLGGW